MLFFFEKTIFYGLLPFNFRFSLTPFISLESFSKWSNSNLESFNDLLLQYQLLIRQLYLSVQWVLLWFLCINYIHRFTRPEEAGCWSNFITLNFSISKVPLTLISQFNGTCVTFITYIHFINTLVINDQLVLDHV